MFAKSFLKVHGFCMERMGKAWSMTKFADEVLRFANAYFTKENTHSNPVDMQINKVKRQPDNSGILLLTV